MDKAGQTNTTAGGGLASGAPVEHTSTALMVIEARLEDLDDAVCALALLAERAIDCMGEDDIGEKAALRFCVAAIGGAVGDLVGDVRTFKREPALQAVGSGSV